MTTLTDLEINKRLALAIGWKQHQIQDAAFNGSILICVEVATLSSDAWWCRFDYRDPAVIWPIAERYNCFPLKSGAGWWASTETASSTEHTAAKAVALAVIGSAK